MDEKAQFYVFEAIAVIIMLLLSLVFVYTLSPPPTASPYSSTQLKILADEALYILRNTPASENYIPAANACVGRWDFEEGSGNTTNDTSGNDNHGTLYGNASFTSSSVHGNYAMEFDGEGDYVDCGNDEELNLTTNFTLAAWINCEDPLLGVSVDNTIVSKHYQFCLGIFNGTGNDSEWPPIDCPPLNKTTLIWYDDTSGSWHYFGGNTSLMNHTWYHLAATYDGTDVKLYVNGELDKTYNAPNESPLASDDSVMIGARDASWNFNGNIDDVYIWNRTLSWEEINTTYNLGVQGSHENILTQWIMTNDDTSFVANMSKMLPETVFYQVRIYDGVNTYWWYRGEKQELADTIVRSHYIISHGTRIYDVELEMWSII
jgi:hypothetical protein